MDFSNAIEAVSHTELIKLTALFNSVSPALSTALDVDVEYLNEQFHVHVSGILEKLQVRLASVANEMHLDEILTAKYGLYDFIFQQACYVCSAGESG
jgi:hypothetical protein